MPLLANNTSDDTLGIGHEDLIVMVGTGKEQLREVCKWVAQEQLILYEPNPDERAALEDHGANWDALAIVSDETQLQDKLARHLVYVPGRRVALMAPPEYRDRHPDVLQKAAHIVEQVVTWADINHGTTRSRILEWLDCLTSNTPYLATLPDVSLLTGQLPRVPAIIVGAGPSIDDSLDDIAFGAERGVVLAAASALGPMAKAGLKPHIVLAMEARDESRQFTGDGLKDVFLVAASTSHPNHFMKWPGPKGLFHMYPWLAKTSGGQSLPTGGHVTSAAFSLATIWDCDPIILVGQDLAYTGDRAYGSGRAGAEEAMGNVDMAVEAIGGGAVRTTVVMHTYRLWYEEAARVFQSRWPDKRFINATKAGAYIEGFEYTSIRDALGDHPCFINGPKPILKALQNLPRPAERELDKFFEHAVHQIDEVTETLIAVGPDAAHKQAVGESAADFAFRNLAPPDADAGTLRQALDQMCAYISRIRANLA